MPYALVLIGLLMIVTGINNTYSQFASQLRSDMTGENAGGRGFIAWVVALFAVGALGYIENLRQFSHYFMALILISMILANKGVFAQLQKALASGPEPATSGASTSGVGSGQGTFGGPSLKESLQKPGGGGFWNYFKIPEFLRPSWAQP